MTGILDAHRMYSSHSAVGGGAMTPAPAGNVKRHAFSYATTPAEKTKVDNANHVFINNSGSFYFLYRATGSEAATAANYTFGIKGGGDPEGSVSSPVRLDINPCAWSGSDGPHRTGDVTFVYRGN